MSARTLVWFRGKELRVSDHRPLHAALQRGDEIVPLFVLDPYFFAPARAQRIAPRIQFLLESLVALEKNLAHLGSRLFVVEGKSTEVVPRLAARWRVDRVVSQRWTEPFARERDRRITAALKVPFELFEGETLLPPETLRTGGGTPYTVFTPFARAFEEKADAIGAPHAAPHAVPPPPADVKCPEAVPIPTPADLGITPNPNLIAGGEAAAIARLNAHLRGTLADYPTGRDRLDLAGTSRLGPDLKFGTLSPRRVWRAVEKSAAAERSPESARVFLKQLIWREFGHATLWDRPKVLEEPFRASFKGFPWRDADGEAKGDWQAWVDGTTGYPVVDASARQLIGEGMVHNRARMISASFLAKHLMVDFRRGEAWYMERLVDGDWANNDMGWQWSAGCGCDAQPYFRIFNPTLQGERFDPEGNYVRRWVPELARVPATYIHEPWKAPAGVLASAGVTLGKTYPKPVVNHPTARDRFLKLADGYLKGGRG